MAKYRKLPVEIEAVQFTGFDNQRGQVKLSERPDWLVNEFGNKIIFFDEPDTLTIKTLEGDMKAEVGDWIIRGISGEFYPCKPDIFEQTYEAVE